MSAAGVAVLAMLLSPNLALAVEPAPVDDPGTTAPVEQPATDPAAEQPAGETPAGEDPVEPAPAEDLEPQPEAGPAERAERLQQGFSADASPAAAASVMNFCTPGVWSLGAAERDMRQVTDGAVDAGVGWFRDLGDDAMLGGLAIQQNGASAYVASVHEGNVTIQALEAQLAFSEQLFTGPAANLTAIDGGAIRTNSSQEIYYFGGYGFDGTSVSFELYGYDLASGSFIGQVARVLMPGAAAAGTGDMVFDAVGNLLLLWSAADGGTSVLAEVPAAAVPTTVGTPQLTASTLSAPQSTVGRAWGGLAFDSIGGLWIQGTDGTNTVTAQLNRTTGAVSGPVTTAGYVGVDLASCGPSTTLVLQKNLVSRSGAGDQFTLRVGTVGSSSDLASVTTTGSTLGLQSAKAGPVPISAGAYYTIGESGANGASPGDYSIAYACVWSSDGSTFASSASLGYNTGTGRAQAQLPRIPAGHEGDTLTCTITNTAKAAAQTQPKLRLEKKLAGNRQNTGDQFTLSISRSGATSALTSTTTTGTGSTVANGATSLVIAEVGQTYSISEVGAGSTVLMNYTATYACVWSGGGEFARGALAASNGKMQAQLPAIPNDRSNQTLSCTITNQVKPVNGFICSPDTVYFQQRGTDLAVPVTPSGVGTATKAFNNTSGRKYNAFGINRDGSKAIVLQQTSSAATSLEVQIWDASTNPNVTKKTITGPEVPANVIGGAVDPTTGHYYFGAYGSSSPYAMKLFKYDPAGTTYTSIATITVSGSNAAGNGDVAFDASGNLYLMWSVSGTHRLARVNTATLAAGGAITATQISTWGVKDDAAYNGITFDGNGNLWVSTGINVQRINPTTGATLATIETSGAVDMASCGLPPTMKLQKNITERAQGGDQFTIEIHTGNAPAAGATASQTALTTGSTPGIQTAVAGPTVVTVGQQYTIREKPSRANALNDYITSYSCTWSDDQAPFAEGVLTGTAGSREQALPSVPAGKAGQQLVCTITNEPLIPATISVKKTLLDARGNNPVPAAGWQMGVAVEAARGGSATIAPPGSQTTVTGGSVPEPWNVTYANSGTVADLVITETQQAGFQFVDGSCVITPRIGAKLTVPITEGSVKLKDPVTAQNRAIRPGDQVECEFRNQPLPGSVTWQKVGEGTPAQHLAGSEWALSGPGVPPGTIVVDCVAANDAACPTGDFVDRDSRAGYFKLTGLSKGNHTFVEEKAPAGYVRDNQTPHRFSIEVLSAATNCVASSSSGGVPKCLNVDFDKPFVNRMQTMPQIPLTGGLGTDTFLVAAGGLFALAVAGAWYWRRRQRDA